MTMSILNTFVNGFNSAVEAVSTTAQTFVKKNRKKQRSWFTVLPNICAATLESWITLDRFVCRKKWSMYGIILASKMFASQR